MENNRISQVMEVLKNSNLSPFTQKIVLLLVKKAISYYGVYGAYITLEEGKVTASAINDAAIDLEIASPKFIGEINEITGFSGFTFQAGPGRFVDGVFQNRLPNKPGGGMVAICTIWYSYPASCFEAMPVDEDDIRSLIPKRTYHTSGSTVHPTIL